VKKKERRQKLLILLLLSCLLSGCSHQSAINRDVAFEKELSSVEGFMPERVWIIFKRSCESCHGFNGRGIAGVAPDLKQGRSRTEAQWSDYLRNSKNIHPVTQLPPVWLDTDEIIAMSAYLARPAR
jgi:hypothetical protein